MPSGLASRHPIHVTFRYDQSGQVDVEAIEYRSNTTLSKQRVDYEEPDLTVLAPPRKIVFAIDVSAVWRNITRLIALARLYWIMPKAIGWRQPIEISVVAFGSQAKVVCELTSDYQVLRQAFGSPNIWYNRDASGFGIGAQLVE